MYNRFDSNEFPAELPTPRSTKKALSPRGIVSLVLTCAIVGGSAGLGGAALYQQISPAAATTVIIQNDTGLATQSMTTGGTGTDLSSAYLYATNVSACVSINVKITTLDVFGDSHTSSSSGSGFLTSHDGYVLTSHHVVGDACGDTNSEITISFSDGTSKTATVVGYDEDYDVAVLKIANIYGFKSVVFGSSGDLVVGDTVSSIGNALGSLDFTFTTGVVSALNRPFDVPNGNTLEMIQTSCALNPGNSGGPVFDGEGHVIGIVTGKYSYSSGGLPTEGLSFVTPIDYILPLIPDLIEYGYVTGKPYLGVQVVAIGQADLDSGIHAGALVSGVAAGSCVETAGLLVGDIIAGIDKRSVSTPEELILAMKSYQAGDVITLTVIRNDQEIYLTVTLDEKNPETESANLYPETVVPEIEIVPQEDATEGSATE